MEPSYGFAKLINFVNQKKDFAMEVRIGDKVRFLNTTGEGIVTKIVDNAIVEVKDETGFNIPVLKSELVVIPSTETQTTQKTNQQPEPEITQNLEPESNTDVPGNDIPKLFFAVVPQSPELLYFDLYLINDCNFHFLYNFSVLEDGLYYTYENGVAESNLKVFLKSLSRKSVNDNLIFNIQGLFFKKKGFSLQEPVQEKIEISAVKLFKHGVFKENDFFNEDALIIEFYNKDAASILQAIENADFMKVIKEKEAQFRSKKFPSKKENKEERNKIVEVDLHIHELVETEQGLEAKDKLDIQLHHFEEKLNEAIVQNQSKIVFIHGVGNGILKMKLRSILDKTYPTLKYQDASFEKYKFGATLVNLR